MPSRPSMAPSLPELTRTFVRRIREHDVSALSAQAAYHTLLSIFPWLVLLEYTARLFPRFREALWLPLWRSVLQDLPPQITAAMEGLSLEVRDQPRSILLPLALAVTLWSASSVVRVLNKALDRAFEVPRLRLHGLRTRLVSLAVILGAGLALGLLSWVLVILPRILPAFLNLLGLRENTQALLSTLTLPAGLAGVYLTAFSLYALLPHQRPPKRSLAWGALIAASGWLAAGRTLAWYVPRMQPLRQPAGGLGAVIAAMIFVYVAAWIFIAAAELVAVISPRSRNQGPSASETRMVRRGHHPEQSRRGRKGLSIARKPEKMI